MYQCQLGLETELEDTFVDLPLATTLARLIRMGHSQRAQKMRQDFQFSDRRYWMVQVLTLAELREWRALDALAQSKKSPIGYAVLYHQNIGLINI